MIIGGCRHFDEDGELVEEPGWIGRFADVIDVERGNLGKIISGQRTLTRAMEERLESAVRAWKDREVTFIRQAILLSAQIDVERQAEIAAAREAARLAAELENEDAGPAPQIGG
jgi:plasmid maintenance system antidote protein VapI